MPDQQSIYVAIADDHVVMRAGLAALLHSLGHYHILYEADDGTELLHWLSLQVQKPDICIIDICMKPMDGFETTCLLKDRYPEIAVLALSMLENDFSIVKMLRSGAKGYLHKGTDAEDLEHALQTIYTGAYYHSELVSERALEQAQRYYAPGVSRREAEFLSLCCTEYVYKEIADRMGVSLHTVHGYRDALFEKLNLNSRTALAIYALRSGIVIF